MQILLYKLRKEKGLSQDVLSSVIHVSVNQYGKKERGEAQFTQDEMFAIADFFKMPIAQIFLPRKSPKWELKSTQH
ncbi:helix-turn-helix transcriptional regulator [Streptococcus agalactiae]|uniref:helix-turn-helix transcriptional regulator n=1 Tax=Streptococcus agalactiae TaxID=1311 RepID=UPI0002DA43C8|nr:helix-turn-helix transcriptional regulator [Streptococcus agalactiae]EPX15485.1 Cro/Cl family transcriptional regulator [Streptococcus agalactiae LDS 610]ASA89470.1 transcriptional regulator [Streptococcus agalactiae]NHZ68990.1 helix-turn-helix domain-containing protein [Streptococcus agalactiae]HEN4418818.1 helix-turn-helix transcriptional regulator [Streptococcus agalactiae]HEN4473260.1 helix-turn-helix transcriptional regulator [Streptococcus agalactiae]